MKGLDAAKEFHDNNTGLPYVRFKLEKDGESANVRVLALALPDENRPDMPVIETLTMHNKYKVLNSTRCAAGDELKRNPDVCPLCRVKATRSAKTFIPVRVRKSKDKTEVQVIEYGRNNIAELVSLLEEIPGGDITSVDFKVKRVGEKTKTTYKWFPVSGTERPLNAEELALEVPIIEELIPIKPQDELEKLAREWERSEGAKKTGGTNDNDDENDPNEEAEEVDDDEIPF